MKQIIQKKIIRTVTLWMLVMTMGLSMTGCGSVAATSKSQSLDIDYVGGDGEITEDEVTAKSESPMEWLKKKLSGEDVYKRQVVVFIEVFMLPFQTVIVGYNGSSIGARFLNI